MLKKVSIYLNNSCKVVIIGLIILALVISNAITLKLYLDTFISDENQVVKDTGDELSRTKFFIKDWYDELSESYGEPKVYYNELQFSGGKYTLTVAADRIRAVYPRGVRTFQLEYVSYIEFFKEENALYCRLYYDGENGELRFLLDNN